MTNDDSVTSGGMTIPRSVSSLCSLCGHCSLLQKVGSEPLDALAHKIWESEGPSGLNKVSIFRSIIRESTNPFRPPLSPVHRSIFTTSQRRFASSLPESHDSHLYALEVCVYFPFLSLVPLNGLCNYSRLIQTRIRALDRSNGASSSI